MWACLRLAADREADAVHRYIEHIGVRAGHGIALESAGLAAGSLGCLAALVGGIVLDTGSIDGFCFTANGIILLINR